MNENDPFLKSETHSDDSNNICSVCSDPRNPAEKLISSLLDVGVEDVAADETKLSGDVISLPWNRFSIVIAVIIVFGSAASTLLHQHVAVLEPEYFFSLSVFVPLSGLVFYTLLILGLEWYTIFQSDNHLIWGKGNEVTANATTSTVSSLFFFLQSGYRRKIGNLFWLMLPVAFCFSVNNILLAFGSSGNSKSPGTPEIPTVVLLVLQKLVVPVSLVLESLHDQRVPRWNEIIGILLILMGAIVTSLAYDSSQDSHDSTSASPLYHVKLASVILSTFSLASGFLLVKRATNALPTTANRSSEIELWAVLCFPELIFSILLSFAAQRIKHSLSFASIVNELLEGIGCVVLGIHPSSSASSTSASYCDESTRYSWMALVPGFAFNLSIPMLVKVLNDSTVIPVLRTVAFPIALIFSMSGMDPVIGTPFSWEGVFGLIITIFGLFVCYCH